MFLAGYDSRTLQLYRKLNKKQLKNFFFKKFGTIFFKQALKNVKENVLAISKNAVNFFITSFTRSCYSLNKFKFFLGTGTLF